MKKSHLRNTTFYVGLGYFAIFCLLIVSAGFSYQLEQKNKTALIALSQYQAQQTLVEQLLQHARDRSLLLLNIISLQDPFEIEEKRPQFTALVQQIMTQLQQYEQHPVSSFERSKLDRIYQSTTLNRDLQNNVIELAIDEQTQAALDLLVKQTLPIQEEVLTLFQSLYQFKQQQHLQAQQQFNENSNAIKTLWIFTLLALFITLGLVSYISLKKIRRAQLLQEQFQHTLENKVKERTKETVLDSAILHSIHESIAVTNEKGDFIKGNINFNDLLQAHQINPREHLIWSYLSQVFDGINTDALFEQAITQGQARQEITWKKNRQHHFLIDVHQILDSRLDDHYLCFVFTDISHLKQTQKELEKLANYDLITQLANRHAFQKTLADWISENHQFALFFIDLDNFKWVNDTQGHAAGDHILIQVGESLTNQLLGHPAHLIARLGGDEFGLLYQYQDELALGKLAQQLIDNIKLQYQPSNPSQTLGASIGIATYPKDGQSLEDLMRHADFAMYKAKEQGKNSYCLFSDKMNEHIHYLYESEINLHRGLERNEFFLVYQPQYNLQNGQLIGAEALIRWQQGERLISPGEFIPLAEKFGLIEAIGKFVLNSALQQLQHWQQNSQTIERLSINVSSAQLSNHHFNQLVQKQLAHYQIHPTQLDIEITESMLIDHLGEQNTTLSELQQLGVEISIDDFGTGYSSLAYIKHLNVDRIKIDRSFIQDLEYNTESHSIVKAIITMGQSLGMKVLAEGIETAQQLQLLRELGCDEGQGYLLGKPMAANQLAQSTHNLIPLSGKETLQ